MRNIVLARVDDRLIHGEVIMGWVPVTRATRIIIVDDEVANNAFNSRIIKALAPETVKCFIFTVEQAAEKLMKEGTKKERLLVLAKTPLTFKRLIEAGVPIKEVNIGGVGIREDRKNFYKNISLSRAEVEACKEMVNRDCRVYYQLVPEQSTYEIDMTVIKEAEEKF